MAGRGEDDVGKRRFVWITLLGLGAAGAATLAAYLRLLHRVRYRDVYILHNTRWMF